MSSTMADEQITAIEAEELRHHRWPSYLAGENVTALSYSEP